MQALQKFAKGRGGGERWHPVKWWATEKSFTLN